jgi:hypothetical protein
MLASLVGWLPVTSMTSMGRSGQVTYPMGANARGYLLHTADGRFSVTISRVGRPPFAAGDLLGGTTEEKARAVEGFVAYAAATASITTASSIMSSCRCSPTGSAATRSGGSNWPGTG